MIKQRSEKADMLHREARAYVDEVEHHEFDGRIPMETAERVYRAKVCELAARYMREQSQPITDYAVKLSRLSTKIGGEPLPPELVAAIDAMQKPWRDAVAELLGATPGEEL